MKTISKNGVTYYKTARHVQKAYYERHKNLILMKQRIRWSENKEIYRASYKLWHYNQRRRRKIEAIAAYGGKCACCGESELQFLCIDHINGGGNKHRATIKGGSLNFYRWLKRNGYPYGFRVLCWNCNASYGLFGNCPHVTTVTTGV